MNSREKKQLPGGPVRVNERLSFYEMATKNPSIAETATGERALEGPRQLQEVQTGLLSFVLGGDYPTTCSYVNNLSILN